MKTNIIILSIAFIIVSFTSTAQVKVDVEKKLNNEANQRANSNTDKAIDKAFDSVEEGIGNLFKKKKGSAEAETTEKKAEEPKPQKQTAEKEPKSDVNEPVQLESAPAPQLTWAKYDFVPGTEIFFEDYQEGEQNGEFPSKWDLAGGVVENAFFDESNVIYFREIGNIGGITPLLKDSKSDYLPDEFTIEFDCYFEKEVYSQRYYVSFYAAKKQKSALKRLVLYTNGAQYGTTDIQGIYPGASRSNIDKIARWRHIAISFNKRALKVYMDDARLLNIPNVEENPTGLTLGTTSQTEKKYFIKNIRIAKGAVPLYDKFLTDGKFVTTGIKFDVNKATIKPESMGTINYVVKMMTDHPELKFSVEGHTDSDGDDALNQKLSEARAKAVMEKMTELGISADRLTSKGHGESKPMAGNDTPEGKAQNRRVEFVKF